MQPTNEALLRPPGVIGSLKAGFDTVAAHIGLILMPLLLDLWLWLGPRLSIERIFSELRPDLAEFWRAAGVPSADLQTLMQWYESALHSVNLFWLLRTAPIGVSSLLLGRDVARTPLGAASTWQAQAATFPAWILLLVLAGWVTGSLYFRWVAGLSVRSAGATVLPAQRALFQTLLLSLIWVGAALSLAVPTLIVVGLLLQLNVLLAQIVILALSFFSMWLIVPLFFWPHGIFVKKQNALLSMLSSIQMARFTLPSSSFFVLSVVLLGVGLNFLWNAAPTESWMTLVGILGHAFITTALLAASFIYYQEMTTWLETLLQRIRTAGAAAKRA